MNIWYSLKKIYLFPFIRKVFVYLRAKERSSFFILIYLTQKLMRKYFYFLSMLALLCACSQEEQNVPELMDDSPRITFIDSQEFMDTSLELLQKDYQGQTEWANSQIPNSILNKLDQCDDVQMLAMPRGYQALFNDKMEFQVADSIFRFEQGNLFLIGIGKIKLKEKVQCGQMIMTASTSLDDSEIQEYSPNSGSTRNTHFDLAFGKISVPSHQHEFKIESKTKYTFKYVHEFVSYLTNLGGVMSEVLVLRLKLEYRGSGSWKAASEKRNIDIDMHTNVSIQNYTGNISQYYLNTSLRNVQYNQEGLVASVNPKVAPLPIRVWTVNASGTIKHSLVDYGGKEWNDGW